MWDVSLVPDRSYRFVRLFILSIATILSIAWLSIVVLNKEDRLFNWDRVAYVALVLRERGVSNDQIRTETYKTLKHEWPISAYAQVTGVGIKNPQSAEYMRLCSQDDKALISQLSFYQSRYAYVLTIDLLERLGLSFTNCFYLLSFLPSVGIVLAFACFLRKNHGEFFAPVILLFTTYSLIFARLPQFGTPDALCAFLFVGGLLWVFESVNPVKGLLLLMLSVLIRPDNALTVVITSFLILFRNHDKKYVYYYIVNMGVSIAMLYIFDKLSGAYPLRVLLYNSLVSPLAYPTDTIISWTWTDHVAALRSNLHELRIAITPSILFIGGAILSLKLFQGTQKRTVLLLILASIVVSSVKYLLMPHVEYRYYIFSSFIALIGLSIAACKGNTEYRTLGTALDTATQPSK
jgi:hypothetical protein